MVFGKPVRHPCAPIMTDQVKALVAQLGHDFHHVLRHGALGIIRMVGQAFGFGRAAVTAQIRTDHGVILGKLRRDLVPASHGLRIAVQQQHGLALTGVNGIDHGRTGTYALVGEAGKKCHGVSNEKSSPL